MLYLVQQRRLAFCLERHRAGEHRVGDDAKAVDIGSPVQLAPMRLLG